MNNTLKRLTIEATISLHTEIKQLASRRNISMRVAITRALYAYIDQEKKYDRENTLEK